MVTKGAAELDEQQTQFNTFVERHFRHNFLAAMVHGTFFQLSAAFVSPATILPAFINTLTGSKAIVGVMIAIATGGGYVTQLPAARFLESKPHKQPALIAAISIRLISWFLIAAMTYLWGVTHPLLVLFVFLLLLLIFSMAGGLGTVAYGDVIAKAIPAQRRGRFAGFRYLLGSFLAIGAGFAIRWVLKRPDLFPYPANFALIFLGSALSLSVAFFGFWMIREPVDPVLGELLDVHAFFRLAGKLWRRYSNFRLFILNRLAGETWQISMPFYVLYAKHDLHVSTASIGLFVVGQLAGGMIGNLFWGFLGDRSGNRIVIVVSSLLLVTIPLAALLSPVGSDWIFMLVYVLIGFVIAGRRIGYTNYLLEIAAPDVRSTCIAMNGTWMIPTAFYPIIGGVLASFWTYRWLFWLTTVLALLAFIASWWLREPRQGEMAVCTASGS